MKGVETGNGRARNRFHSIFVVSTTITTASFDKWQPSRCLIVIGVQRFGLNRIYARTALGSMYLPVTKLAPVSKAYYIHAGVKSTDFNEGIAGTRVASRQ